MRPHILRFSALFLAAALSISYCTYSKKRQPSGTGQTRGKPGITVPVLAYTHAKEVVILRGKSRLAFRVPEAEDTDSSPAGLEWSADGRYLAWQSGGLQTTVNLVDTATGVRRSWPCPCAGSAFVGNTLIMVSLDPSILVVRPGSPTPIRKGFRGAAAAARRNSSSVIGADNSGVVVEFESGSKEYAFYRISENGNSERIPGTPPRQWLGNVAWDTKRSVVSFSAQSNGGGCGMADRVMLVFPGHRTSRLLHFPAAERRWNVEDLTWGADSQLYAAVNQWEPCSTKEANIDYKNTEIWRLGGREWVKTGRHLAKYLPISSEHYVGLSFVAAPTDSTQSPEKDLIVGSQRSNATHRIASNVLEFAVQPQAIKESGSAPPLLLAVPLPTTPPAVLGRMWAPYQDGYGDVLPSRIFNGGSPSGLVENIRWSNWGSPRATATGMALWAPNGVSEGTMEPATIIASDLGDCRGMHAYRNIVWFFPQHQQSESSNSRTTIC